MPLQGIEWIIVAVIILVLFLWGPEKLPKLARSVGQAKKEFEKASRGIEEEVRQIGREFTAPSPPPEYRPQPQVSDDKLMEIAKTLGIDTEGKTRDQIAQEIIERTKQSKSSS